MGYQTTYNLQVVTDLGKELSIDEMHCQDTVNQWAEELGIEAEFAMGYDMDARWSWHQEDMRSLSSRCPGVLFKLSGKGEEDEDYWHEYYLDGRCQECRAEVVINYPPFDHSKLK